MDTLIEALINRYKALFDYKSSVKHKYVYNIKVYKRRKSMCCECLLKTSSIIFDRTLLKLGRF